MLNFLISLLSSARYTIDLIVSLVLGLVPPKQKWARWLRFAHYLLMAAIVVGLAIYSRVLEPSGYLPDVRNEFLRQNFWAIVFVLAYVTARGVAVFLKLLFAADMSEFPDIEAAFKEGVGKLAEADVTLGELPVVLLLGFGENGSARERAFFDASRLTITKVGPDRSAVDKPVRLYLAEAADGFRAVYVTAPGAGCLAEQLDKTSSASAPTGGYGGTLAPAGGYGGTLAPGDPAAADKPFDPEETARGPAPTATLAPAAQFAPPPPMAAAPPPSADIGATLPPVPTGGGGGAFPGVFDQAPAPPPPASPAKRGDRYERLTEREIVDQSARLAFLGRLLAAERRESEGGAALPPVSAVVVVTPLAAATAEGGVAVADAVEEDLFTLLESTQSALPSVAIFDGLDHCGGVGEFVGGFDAVRRDSRAGSRFPVGQAIDSGNGLWLVDRCLVDYFRAWVNRQIEADIGSRTNRQLYRFVCDLTGRRKGLIEHVRRAFGDVAGDDGTRLAGLYFSAAGGGEDDRGFVQGALRRAVEIADRASWSARRVRSDRLMRTAAVAVGLLCVALVVWDGWLLWRLVERLGRPEG